MKSDKAFYTINCIDMRCKEGKNTWKVREEELSRYIKCLQDEGCLITEVKLIQEEN